MPNQRPGLDEHVVGREQPAPAGKNLDCTRVAAIAGVRRRVPGGGIDEQAQRCSSRMCRAAVASPRAPSLSRAMSLPSERPRLNTTPGSVPRSGSRRSFSTRRRMYSAKDTPSSAARLRAFRWTSGSSVIWARDVMMATAYSTRFHGQRRHLIRAVAGCGTAGRALLLMAAKNRASCGARHEARFPVAAYTVAGSAGRRPTRRVCNGVSGRRPRSRLSPPSGEPICL